MKRGDVVEVDWPFSDMSGAKRRPAVVVRDDFLDGMIADTMLVKIAGKSYGIPNTEVRLDPTIETFSSLSKVCYARCYEVLTLDEVKVHGVVGSLSATAMQEISNCVMACLGLP